MNEKEVIDALVNLGMGTGEAKVYVALVIRGPESATPLSKKAGVPQPKVYEYLRNLVSVGYVSELETPTRVKVYEAISPSVVMADLRTTLVSKAEQAEKFLNENIVTDHKSTQPLVDFISGFDKVQRRIEDLIAKAERNILYVSSKEYNSFFEMMRDKYNYVEFYQLYASKLAIEYFEASGANLIHLLDIQPSVLFTDVDFERKTCRESSIFTPTTDGNEKFMVIFRNSFAPNYQVKLLLSIAEMTPMVELRRM